jgi:hypothetical protein
MFCHGELALRKPATAHLTEFYVMVSLGGAAGSALVGVAAPLVFRGVYEFSLGLAMCGMLALMLEYRKSWRWDAIWAILAVWLLVVTGAQKSASAAGSRFMARSFYGSLRVTDSIDPATGEPQRTLVHGVVAHGVQLLSPALRHEPTSYYARLSGAGMALRGFGEQPMKVGVIGLGAGNMAAYGRRGDEYRFYEPDPLVIQTAQNEFTFLRDSAAKIELVAGDGRLALERERGRQFDVLAVDAFSGDSIPVHLLSQDAFELYFDHLAANECSHYTSRIPSWISSPWWGGLRKPSAKSRVLWRFKRTFGNIADTPYGCCSPIVRRLWIGCCQLERGVPPPRQHGCACGLTITATCSRSSSRFTSQI